MQKGFTLIEMLVYLALFAIIIGGGVVTVYQIIQNSNALQAKAILQEEGNFILAKLNWALTDSAANVSVAIEDGGEALRVTKTSPSAILRFDLSDDNIRFDGGSGNPLELNSDRIIVSSLNFSQPAANQIQASTTLTTLSDSGKTFSQTFEITKYLRK